MSGKVTASRTHLTARLRAVRVVAAAFFRRVLSLANRLSMGFEVGRVGGQVTELHAVPGR